MAAEGVVRAPDVAGDDVGVGEALRDQGEGVKIVLNGIVAVHDQLHAVFVDEIFELFLHEADHDIDLADPGFVELPDLALDQGLAADLEKRFGRLQVDRDHAHAKACGQNDGAAGPCALAQFLCLRREAHRVVKIALAGQGFQ